MLSWVEHDFFITSGQFCLIPHSRCLLCGVAFVCVGGGIGGGVMSVWKLFLLQLLTLAVLMSGISNRGKKVYACLIPVLHNKKNDVFYTSLYKWQRDTVNPQFNSRKSVQKHFHNLLITFSNSRMGFKVICQLEKELLKGVPTVKDCCLWLFLWWYTYNRGVKNIYTHYLMLLY